jgi:uncharacterized membrane protein
MSAYLTWIHLRGVAPICLAGGGGCETVQASRYAEIMGVSVAALGLAGYAGLLTSALLRDEVGALLGLFVALVSVLFSAYLTWLGIFMIDAICQWCVTSAVLMTVSLLLAVVWGRRSRVEPSKS